jgi:hypothetical protein
MLLSVLKRQRRAWKYQVNDPGAGSGGSAPPTPTPPALEPTSPEEVQLAPTELTLPPELQHELKTLRFQNMVTRGKHAAANKEKAAIATELGAKKAAESAAEAEELKKQGRLQELLDKQAKENEKTISSMRKQLVDSRVAMAAVAAGIPEKYHGLISRNGIVWDAAGNPSGIEEAIAACKATYPEILHVPAGAGNGGNGNVAPPTDLLDAMVPGSMQTYRQQMALNATLAHPGAQPPLPNGAPPGKKFNAQTASKAEIDKRLAELKKGKR